MDPARLLALFLTLLGVRAWLIREAGGRWASKMALAPTARRGRGDGERRMRPSGVVLAAVIAAGCGCGTPSRTSAPARPEREESVTESETTVRELGAPIAAVAPDGTIVVQRGDGVDVLDASLAPVGSLPLGNPDDVPGIWYAVSNGARWVAHVDRTGFVTVWDPREGRQLLRLDPGAVRPQGAEVPLVGPAPGTAASWGAPVFLPGDLLATHHGDGAILWEMPSGRPRCTVSDPSLAIVRETFALGEAVAGVRSGTNQPGVHNAVLVEVDTARCRVRRRHLIPPARDPIVATSAGGEGFVLHRDGLRVIGLEAVSRGRIPVAEMSPSAAHASADGRALVFAGTGDGGGHVGAWLREAGQVAEVAQVPGRERIVHVRTEGDAVIGYGATGRVWRWAMPTAGEPVQLTAMSTDERRMERALLHLGLGEVGEAQRVLGTVSPRDDGDRFLAAYVDSLVEQQDVEAFLRRLESENVHMGGNAALLALARRLADVEVIAAALDAFLYWLDGIAPGAGPDEGVDLGLNLSLCLSESDAYELRGALLRRLADVYPGHPRLAEELEELE